MPAGANCVACLCPSPRRPRSPVSPRNRPSAGRGPTRQRPLYLHTGASMRTNGGHIVVPWTSRLSHTFPDQPPRLLTLDPATSTCPCLTQRASCRMAAGAASITLPTWSTLPTPHPSTPSSPCLSSPTGFPRRSIQSATSITSPLLASHTPARRCHSAAIIPSSTTAIPPTSKTPPCRKARPPLSFSTTAGRPRHVRASFTLPLSPAPVSHRTWITSTRTWATS